MRAGAGRRRLEPGRRATAILAADITAKTISVTGISVENKVYDGTTDATLDLEAAALDGVVDGDDVVLVTAEAVGAFADAGAGEGITVTVTGLELTGPSAGNYVLSETTATLEADITAKTISVTGPRRRGQAERGDGCGQAPAGAGQAPAMTWSW